MFSIKSSVRLIAAVFLVGGSVCGAEPAPSALPSVTVGVVKDGNSWFFDSLTEGIQRELKLIAGDQFGIEFKEAPEFNADWKVDKVRSALDRALRDDEVDIVLTVGLLAIYAAGSEGLKLQKPVACAMHQDARLAGVALDRRGRPLKENLSIVVTKNSVGNDVRVFQELSGFTNRLHLLIVRPYLEGLSGLGKLLEETEKELGVNVIPVPMDDSAEAAVAALPIDVEAVYVGPPATMSESERNKMVRLINERGIPSFAYFGEPAVLNGVLAGLLPDIRQQLARRVAINLHQLMRGVSTAELESVLDPGRQLIINAQTLKQIGLHPPFELLSEANLLFTEQAQTGAPLNLGDAVAAALTNNFELRAQGARTESRRHASRLAGSPLLPQASTTYSAARNRRQSGPSAAFTPRGLQTGGVMVRQILYDDQTVTRYRVARERRLSAEEEEARLRLDITAQTAVGYLSYLSASKFLQIARDNLRVTRKNLELARLRVNAKIAGIQEVYRFQSQEQADKSEVASARSSVEQARVSLNQVMGVELKKLWTPADISLKPDDPYFGYTGKDVTTLLVDQLVLDRFRDYSVGLALAASPEIRSLESAVKAQRLVTAQKRRRFYTPTLSSQFEYSRTLDRVPSNADDRDSWSVGLIASFPLFEGGGRRHDFKKNQSELSALELDFENTRREIAERTRQFFYQIEGSFPAIEYSARASELAEQNLEVVTLQYQQGEAAVIDLLDAQNSAFVQQQNKTLAVYQMLIDLVQFQRSIGWFEFTASDAEKRAWVEKLRAALN